MTEGRDHLAAALTDRYRLEQELGQGGMATVYLAEDLKHGRKVAIKVLRPELAAVIGAERFVREIRTIARARVDLVGARGRRRAAVVDSFRRPHTPVVSPQWALGRDRVYVPVQDRQSDVWVMDIAPDGGRSR